LAVEVYRLHYRVLGAQDQHRRMLDRCIIKAILVKEFPAGLPMVTVELPFARLP